MSVSTSERTFYKTAEPQASTARDAQGEASPLRRALSSFLAQYKDTLFQQRPAKADYPGAVAPATSTEGGIAIPMREDL